MKKIYLIPIIGIIISVICISVALNALEDIGGGVDEAIEKFSLKVVGQKVVIDQDTLTVVDFSLLKAEYLLSDNKFYHHLIIENNFLDKTLKEKLYGKD